MLLLDGNLVSNTHRYVLSERIKEFQMREGKPPGLAVVLVGEDQASQIYVRNKEKACNEIGIRSQKKELSSNVTVHHLVETIHQLNKDENVHGILVQLPLPRHIPVKEILKIIDPLKDVDGFGYENLGLFFSGHPRVSPCTPHGVMKILNHYGVDLVGKKCVVIGRSQIVGKPMALLLLEADATVTICHSKTQELSKITREADVVIVAAGRPREFGKSYFKKDSIVIDVGIHRYMDKDKIKICGDVRMNELEDWIYAGTPVPGGVGPMTITMLLENTIDLAEKQSHFKKEESLR